MTYGWTAFVVVIAAFKYSKDGGIHFDLDDIAMFIVVGIGTILEALSEIKKKL